MQDRDHPLEFRQGDAQGWEEDEDIAQWTEQEAVPSRFGGDVVADSCLERVRFFGRAIRDQFNARGMASMPRDRRLNHRLILWRSISWRGLAMTCVRSRLTFPVFRLPLYP